LPHAITPTLPHTAAQRIPAPTRAGIRVAGADWLLRMPCLGWDRRLHRVYLTARYTGYYRLRVRHTHAALPFWTVPHLTVYRLDVYYYPFNTHAHSLPYSTAPSHP